MTHRYQSTIVHGKVEHWRKEPREHAFSYPIAFFCLDVDLIERIKGPSRLFTRNRVGVYSIYEQDYLVGAPNSASLRARVEEILRQSEIEIIPDQILLLTMPRLFGYVFNPVSFFVCLDAEQRVLALVIQVNNTFGETHVYPLQGKAIQMPCTWRFGKDFFVSPFFDKEGEYCVTLTSVGEKLKIDVDLYVEEQCVFRSTLSGQGHEITPGRIAKTLGIYGFSQLLTMTRIHMQAVLLYWKAGACPFEKPRPTHRNTIRSKQDFIHRIRLKFLSCLRSLRNKRGGYERDVR